MLAQNHSINRISPHRLFQSADAGTKQLFCREVGEKPGEEVEPAFIEAKAVQEHGLDNG